MVGTVSGIGEIDAEGMSKALQAMNDPAEVRVTVIGRNGFELRMNYPIHETEDATLQTLTEIHRNELRSAWTDDPFYEPLPTGRTITWTIETKYVRAPRSES